MNIESHFPEILNNTMCKHAITHFDSQTGSWFFIVIDDDSLGPAASGTRMKTYRSPQEGLIDAIRLASSMTHKWPYST